MDGRVLEGLLKQSATPAAIEDSIVYLTNQLKQFLFPREKVLICFQRNEYGNICFLMQQAVLRCDAVPISLNGDFRWINLLRRAFADHVGCMIAPPLILLGLSKVARAMRTPLFIRNAVLAGYPCLDWMLAGIENGLDCKSWGCFNIGIDGMVCGFSCTDGTGVHVRDDIYDVDIVDGFGVSVPAGEMGHIALCSRTDPGQWCVLPDRGILNPKPCACGRVSPRVVNFMYSDRRDPDLVELGKSLQRWNSILDCRLDKGEYGLQMEIIYFVGERLPRLPTAARLILRPWNPEKDEPFWYYPLSKVPANQPPETVGWADASRPAL